MQYKTTNDSDMEEKIKSEYYKELDHYIDLTKKQIARKTCVRRSS